MVFSEQAANIEHYMRAYLNLRIRQQWDQNINDLNMCENKGKMLVVSEEVESMANGYSEKEVVYKRCFWKQSEDCYVIY